MTWKWKNEPPRSITLTPGATTELFLDLESKQEPPAIHWDCSSTKEVEVEVDVADSRRVHLTVPSGQQGFFRLSYHINKEPQTIGLIHLHIPDSSSKEAAPRRNEEESQSPPLQKKSPEQSKKAPLAEARQEENAPSSMDTQRPTASSASSLPQEVKSTPSPETAQDVAVEKEVFVQREQEDTSPPGNALPPDAVPEPATALPPDAMPEPATALPPDAVPKPATAPSSAPLVDSGSAATAATSSAPHRTAPSPPATNRETSQKNGAVQPLSEAGPEVAPKAGATQPFSGALSEVLVFREGVPLPGLRALLEPHRLVTVGRYSRSHERSLDLDLAGHFAPCGDESLCSRLQAEIFWQRGALMVRNTGANPLQLRLPDGGLKDLPPLFPWSPGEEIVLPGGLSLVLSQGGEP